MSVAVFGVFCVLFLLSSLRDVCVSVVSLFDLWRVV